MANAPCGRVITVVGRKEFEEAGRRSSMSLQQARGMAGRQVRQPSTLG